MSCEQWVERNEPQRAVSTIPDSQPESNSNTPGIVLNSPEAVSEQEIYDCFQKYGFKWPNIRIDWPQSSDIVLNSALKIISLFDSGTLEEIGRDYFVQHGPAQVARATNMRKGAALAVPHMVSRLSQFKSRDAIQAVKSFLLYSNYQIHYFMAYLSTWNGLGPLGLSLPPVWQPFTSSFDLEDALPKLFKESDPDRIYHARLRSIFGSDRTRNGEYLYIYAPKEYLGRYEPTVKNESVICEWFIPQVEFDLLKGSVADPEYKGLVSNEYCSEWVFSASRDRHDKEVSSRPFQ